MPSYNRKKKKPSDELSPQDRLLMRFFPWPFNWLLAPFILLRELPSLLHLFLLGDPYPPRRFLALMVIMLLLLLATNFAVCASLK